MSTLDTRDLQERLEELEQEIEDQENLHIEDSELSSLREERDSLLSMKEEISEWDSGVTLIPESEFEDYCRELVEEMGDIPKDLPSYIADHINWEGVANDLRVDYSSIEYDGITYLYSE